MPQRETSAHPLDYLTGQNLSDQAAIIRYALLMIGSAGLSLGLRLVYHWCHTSLVRRLRHLKYHAQRPTRSLLVPLPLARPPPRRQYSHQSGA